MFFFQFLSNYCLLTKKLTQIPCAKMCRISEIDELNLASLFVPDHLYNLLINKDDLY